MDFNIGQDGTGSYAGGQGFNGLVDDVGVWNRVLSPTEINGLFTAGSSLGSLFGTSLNGGSNNIDDSLVGYYAFDGDLTDGAGAAQNGVAKNGTETYAGGQFGNAVSLDGNVYVTIGESSPPQPVNFTGNSATDNLASNDDNWDLAPSTAGAIGSVNVADGTTATFGGANTGPATFDGTFVGATNSVLDYNFGAAGVDTFVTFDAAGSEFIANGGNDTVIGTEGSNVTMVMEGGVLNHIGASEEGSEMEIGRPGSTVNIVMNGTSELSTGIRVADPAYATGFRRPQAADGLSRNGDDLKFAEGNDGDPINVNIEMNDDSVVYTPDVFYPGDSNTADVTVVQNDNSMVIANWDSRFLDDNGGNVNWTMNGNSKFLAARDHGVGETGGAGDINITINDNAEFRAGDRLVFGAGGGNINVVMNGGLMKAGGDTENDIILVDDTGEVLPGEESRAVDWILHMGGGANANLTVNGGAVEIGRTAYIGRGGGNAFMAVRGGTFDVKGIGPSGVVGLGNDPGGGVPSSIDHQSNGGDLIVGYDQGDIGVFEFQQGTVNVARDVVVSFDNDFDGVGGDGTFRLRSGAAPAEGSSFNVANDLSFAGDFLAASGGDASFEVVFDGTTLSPVNVDGDLYIYNTGSSSSDFTVSLAPGGTAPAIGQYLLIDYQGTRGPGGLGNDMFTELASPGFTYSLIYDDVAGQVLLDITAVDFNDCDFDDSGACDATDINALMAEIAAGTNNADFDLTNDGNVNIDDRDAWLADAGNRNIGAAYLVADANLDGAVDGSDFIAWNTNKFSATTNWTDGDFNGDGVADGQDFIDWNNNKFMSSDVSSVPEPAGIALLGFAGLLLAACRRR